MLLVHIDIQRLKGSHIPESEDVGTFLFYDMILRNCEQTIFRISFNHNTKYVHAALYEPNEKIEKYLLDGIYRVFNPELPLELEIFKVFMVEQSDHEIRSINESQFSGRAMDDILLDKYRIAYVRHITRNGHDINTEKVCRFFMKDGQTSWSNVVPGVKIRHQKRVTTLAKPVERLRVSKTRHEEWGVNRKFYQSMGCVHRDNEQSLIYHHLVAVLYKDNSVKDIDSLLKRFQELFKHTFVYDNDRNFVQPRKIVDHNDDSPTLSVNIDCEDAVCLYMHCFRALFSTYKFCMEHTHPMYKLIQALEQTYRPMAWICRIDNGGSSFEFHATMLLVPYTLGPAWIFEVTNNHIGGVVDSPSSRLYSKYRQYHALIDRNFITCFKDDLKKVLHEMKFDPDQFSNV